jgi:hypothetical protein
MSVVVFLPFSSLNKSVVVFNSRSLAVGFRLDGSQGNV